MIRAALIWLCLALPVSAQELPNWTATTINDFAGLLTNADKQTIDQALIALRKQAADVVLLGIRSGWRFCAPPARPSWG